MTITSSTPAIAPPEESPPIIERHASRWRRLAAGSGQVVVAVVGAFVIFGAFMLARGTNPFDAYGSMWSSTFTSGESFAQILVKAVPLILAALAVAVPARAGLVNVGGEGQLVIGGVAAVAAQRVFGDSLPTLPMLVMMALFAAVAGALWAGVCAVLRLTVGINEAVTTLLLNYVALDLMLFLIYDQWKDPNGSGQPTTPPLAKSQELPMIGNSTVHAGFLMAIVLTGIIWWVLTHTSWGFRLRVVGGNPEAARQAGMRVGLLLASAMLVGGALAGLGGFAHLAGVEHKLRPGFLVTYGYVGFLASWLVRHSPVRVAIAAIFLAAIAVGGDSLQLDSGLPAASVNILMALVLLAVFGWGNKRKALA